MLMVALTAAWRWTPLHQWVDVSTLVAAVKGFKASPFAPLIILAAFLVGGIIAFPISVLFVATLVSFGPFLGFTYCLVGAVTSAALTFSAGHLLGRSAVQKLMGSRLDTVSRKLSRHGLWGMAVIRIVPIAPYAIINVAAGASPIRFRDFIAGTALGILPGLIAMTLFIDRVKATLWKPGPKTFLALAAAVAAILIGLLLLKRWLAKRGEISEEPGGDNH
ncbi:MAG: VTT domain-containing protein [Acidobacteriota bacterium]